MTGVASPAATALLLVVKLGGRTQADPALPTVLADVWSARQGRVVIVHGGGDQISMLQQQRGDTPQFVGGRRVTTVTDLEVVRMALSGLANKQLVSAFVAAGVPAVGVSGEDAGFLRASPIDSATFGYAGTPVRVDVRLLHTLLDHGFMPVLSPVSAHEDVQRAQAMNVNGDDAAAAIAAALGADELFFMADVAAVRDEHSAPLHTVTPNEAAALISSAIAAGGMAAKLEAGLHALEHGVRCVRIGDLAGLPHAESGTSLIAG